MINKNLFRSEMVKYGDTQETLAKDLNISVSRLNAKINSRDGAQFNSDELIFLSERYSLDPDHFMAIFFTEKVFNKHNIL